MLTAAVGLVLSQVLSSAIAQRVREQAEEVLALLGHLGDLGLRGAAGGVRAGQQQRAGAAVQAHPDEVLDGVDAAVVHQLQQGRAQPGRDADDRLGRRPHGRERGH